MAQNNDVLISLSEVTKVFSLVTDHSSSLCSEADSFIKNPVLYFKNKKKYKALDNINLQVNRGEIVGLYGQNGSGKTTLMRLITRVSKLTDGKVYINGRVVPLIFIFSGYSDVFTGRENIYFLGSMYGITKKEIDKVVDDIIDFAQIREYIDQPIKKYSTGMMVRLVFSVAIYSRPDVIVMDEAFFMVDTAFYKKCFDKLLQMKMQGLSVIIVSHSLGTLDNLCDRIIYLKNGKMVGREEYEPIKCS